MKKSLLALLMIVFVFSCSKKGDDSGSNDVVTDGDKEFVSKAAMANNAEIELGELSISQATNVDIRNYSRSMVAEHTDIQTQLSNLATALSITIPTTMDDAHIALKNQLMGLSGRAFDSTYIKNQKKDHEDMIALFENQVSAGGNGNLKNFASSTLPKLRMHLESANNLAALFP